MRNSTGVDLWPHSELCDSLWTFHGYFKKRAGRFLAASEAPTGDGCLSLIALCVWLINQYDGSLLFIKNESRTQRRVILYYPCRWKTSQLELIDKASVMIDSPRMKDIRTLISFMVLGVYWSEHRCFVSPFQSVSTCGDVTVTSAAPSCQFFEFALRLWIFAIVCCLFPESFLKISFCFFF